MSEIILDARMKCIAECVPEGAVLADIGTDHGKLPVYLGQKGIIRKAVAADINEMPLQKAVNNIKKHGLEQIIDTYLTDGLKGIGRFSPDCVVIAGMGGELIEQILDEADICREAVRFILQPMTKEESLRRYLCEGGYKIYDEHIVREGKIYQIICAVYDGVKRSMTEAEYYLGHINIENNSPLLLSLIEKVEKRIRVKIDGKTKACLDITEENMVLKQILAIKEKRNGDGK